MLFHAASSKPVPKRYGKFACLNISSPSQTCATGLSLASFPGGVCTCDHRACLALAVAGAGVGCTSLLSFNKPNLHCSPRSRRVEINLLIDFFFPFLISLDSLLLATSMALAHGTKHGIFNQVCNQIKEWKTVHSEAEAGNIVLENIDESFVLEFETFKTISEAVTLHTNYHS